MNYVLDDSWKEIYKLVLYGFGKTAKGSIDKFVDNFSVISIIDNDPKKNGIIYRNIKIINFEQFRQIKDTKDIKIVLLVAGKARKSVKKDLDSAGFREGVNYTDLDTFSTEWYFSFQGKFNIGKIGESITNRCTFRCKGCNMLMPYYKKPVDYQIDMLKEDVDLLFSLVDEVNCFSVIGGEPLLHPEVGNHLEYIGVRYKDRIGNLQLISNGSVQPSARTLEKCREYDVEVRLSDYTNTIPYFDMYSRVRDAFKNAGIRTVEFKQTEWIDFGFPEQQISMAETGKELREHMLNCHGMCHWLHDGKMYYCSNAWSAQETGMIKLNDKQDYVDLRELFSKSEKGREDLYDFYLGNMIEGYMSHCKRCRGFASTCIIRAGIQM